MSNATSAQNESVSQTILRLVSLGEYDTLYRDLYMQRARKLMETILTGAAYANLKNNIASLGLLERQLKAAIERGNWQRTAELTERVRAIRASTDRKGIIELGEAVYDKIFEIPVDPFSPGFHAFYNSSEKILNDWREHAIEALSVLENTDSSKRDFYARRRADFQTLKIEVHSEKQKKETVNPVDLRQEALNAVDSGDLSSLDDLIKKLSAQSAEKNETEAETGVQLAETANLGDDLLYSFSEATLAAAAKLGLTNVKTSSRRDLAYLLSYRWQPSFLKSESKKWAQEQLTHLLPATGDGDKIRETIEMYLLNPFINSGGTRYQVCLVVEDLLIEDFPEPQPKSHLPRTELLAALGLESRWGLSRQQIETALLENGPRILEEKLGLNAEEFRLVAIPPDIYTNLGTSYGWGEKEMWTHFDGYWVREGGNLQALAGGDVRFGGAHDVIGFHPGYNNEKLLARFAVVQRRRMMTWHRR
jgi:hypothetical protein